jgi:hypothetical protein
MFLFTVCGAEGIKCLCCKLHGRKIYDVSKYCPNCCEYVPILFNAAWWACGAVADRDIQSCAKLQVVRLLIKSETVDLTL